MTDVYIAFGTLLALGIVFPGLLFSCWLIFPNVVGRAEERLAHTPGRSFLFGLLLTGAVAIPVLVLSGISLPFTSFLAALVAGSALAVSVAGAAGLAAHMGQRLIDRSDGELSRPAAFLRAAVALEFAAAFPLLGWFLIIPLTIIASLGAAAFAVMGWRPRQPQTAPTGGRVVVQVAGGQDVS